MKALRVHTKRFLAIKFDRKFIPFVSSFQSDVHVVLRLKVHLGLEFDLELGLREDVNECHVILAKVEFRNIQDTIVCIRRPKDEIYTFHARIQNGSVFLLQQLFLDPVGAEVKIEHIL